MTKGQNELVENYYHSFHRDGRLHVHDSETGEVVFIAPKVECEDVPDSEAPNHPPDDMEEPV